ncbi:MAG: GNAT family N-acetyltransferase [Magnetovibrio sp.]|nr:GNAT family N-acetyltransferase [Magnetovibrio sp.]|tara:strand:- start:98 stop:622 length:525 start_codon:yes stop_codon:yes gene_type:complete
MSPIIIRDACEDDCTAIQAIYSKHVLHGLASWEEVPPEVVEISNRMKNLMQAGYPYRVVELNGEVKGFAYAGSYRPRRAYRHTVENSIYIASSCTGMGLGSSLLEDLIKQCTNRGYRQMVAVIGDSENIASIKLHTAHGFKHCGTLRSLGFKHGKWLNQILMQKSLGKSDTSPP